MELVAGAGANGLVDPESTARAARELYLDDRDRHGCAESTFVSLKRAYGLGDADDPSAAMALNGGVALSGGACGAITGAALALGLLPGERAADHQAAKVAARDAVAALMEAFRAQFGSTDCRDLTGLDLRAPAAHEAFLAGGRWRLRCADQVEFVVRRVAPLAGDAAWPGVSPEAGGDDRR